MADSSASYEVTRTRFSAVAEVRSGQKLLVHRARLVKLEQQLEIDLQSITKQLDEKS